MYACPSCGQPTLSFWRKSTASDIRPTICGGCGRKVVLQFWPQVALFIVVWVIVALCVEYALFSRSSWPNAVAVVFSLVAFVAFVHVCPMTAATAQRTRLVHFLSGVFLLAFIGWFAWEVMHHAPAP